MSHNILAVQCVIATSPECCYNRDIIKNHDVRFYIAYCSCLVIQSLLCVSIDHTYLLLFIAPQRFILSIYSYH